MAFSIGKKKDDEPKAPKVDKKAQKPAEPAAAPAPATPAAPAPAAPVQRQGAVRGGKKSKARKTSALSKLGSKTIASRSGGSTLAGRGKAPAFNIQDVILRAFPTLAKAMGKEAGPAGKPQKRKKKTQKPTLPMVNLLPPRFTIIRERNSAIRGFVISGLGILVAAGTMYVIQGTAIGSAQNTLNAAQGQIAESTTRLSQYGDVGSFFDQVQQRLTLEKTLKAAELDFVSIFNEVQSSIPGGVTVVDITITPPPAAADGSATGGNVCGPQADPFSKDTKTPVACIKIQGSLASLSTLTALNNGFADSKFLFNVLFVQSASDLGGTGGILFTGTAAISSDALMVNTNLAAEKPATPTTPTAPNAPGTPVNPAVPVTPAPTASPKATGGSN